MNIKLSSEKRKRNNEDKTILKNEVTCMNVIGGKPELTTLRYTVHSGRVPMHDRP